MKFCLKHNLTFNDSFYDMLIQ